MHMKGRCVDEEEEQRLVNTRLVLNVRYHLLLAVHFFKEIWHVNDSRLKNDIWVNAYRLKNQTSDA